MKLIFKISALLLAVGFTACEKVETKVTSNGGTAPALTSNTTTVRNEPGEESNLALQLNWTNPNYQFSTGLSSQDVNYTLEIDTVGVNFSSANKYQTIIGKDLSKSFTVGELNNIFGNTMLLPVGFAIPRKVYTFETRVVSSIGPDKALKLSSNIIRFTAKPFAPPPKVVPPVAGDLWGTGDAFASSWSNPLAAPFSNSQKFTKLTDTEYQLTISMNGGGGYKLLFTNNGNWGNQYRMLPGGTWDKGEFDQRDADPAFPGPPGPGTYKINFNFQTGKFTSVKQ